MNEVDLLSQHCVEYPAGTAPLPQADIERYLAQVPGWAIEEGVVRRKLMFPDFTGWLASRRRSSTIQTSWSTAIEGCASTLPPTRSAGYRSTTSSWLRV
jgi:hypothetical protein